MSSTARKAWVVAASIGAVEALKDQGFARWNYPFRLLQQHANTNLRSYGAQANKLSSAAVVNKKKVTTQMTSQEQKLKQSEESLRKVMYLSCWAPN